MDKLRVALVGLGDAGGHHARALAATPEVAWTAICARSSETLKRFRQRCPVAESAVDVRGLPALLAAGVCDAVVLATPDGLHAEQVVACAEAGLHVLVEKPLALSRGDALRAVEVCRRHSRVLAVGHHLRHHPGHLEVYQRLNALVGTLRRVVAEWAWPDPAVGGWRAQGKQASSWSLAALGTHGIDLGMWLARSSQVMAMTELLGWEGPVDASHELSFSLEGGAQVHVAGSVRYRALSRLTLVGDLGEVECRGTLGARGAGTILHRRLREEPTPVAFEPADPYAAQLRAFVRAAQSGQQDEEQLAAAIANTTLIERVLQHAQSA